MKYVLEYRPRPQRGQRYTSWKEAQRFDDLAEAQRVRDDAIKYEAKGIKDWRVVPVQ